MQTDPKPMSAERLAHIARMSLWHRDVNDTLVADAFDELLAELDRLRGPGGWIRTGERLPEVEQDCWWRTKDEDTWRGSLEGEYVSTGGEFGDFPLETFTHWRPVIVPDPPGEGVANA